MELNDSNIDRILQYHHALLNLAKQDFLLFNYHNSNERLNLKTQRENQMIIAPIIEFFTRFNQSEKVETVNFSINLKNDELNLKTKYFKPVNHIFCTNDKFIPTSFMYENTLFNPIIQQSRLVETQLTFMNEALENKRIFHRNKPLLSYICHVYQTKIGIGLKDLFQLNSKLRTDRLEFSKIWFEQLFINKNLCHRNKQKQEPKIHQIKCFRYNGVFCNICSQYFCLVHFLPEWSDLLIVAPKSQEFQKEKLPQSIDFYKPQDILNSERINQNLGRINWCMNIICLDQTAKSDCYLHLKDQSFDEEFPQLQQFERHFVKFCIKFQIDNPCYMIFCLKLANITNTKTTCSHLFSYMKYYSYQQNQLGDYLSTQQPLYDVTNLKSNQKTKKIQITQNSSNTQNQKRLEGFNDSKKDQDREKKKNNSDNDDERAQLYLPCSHQGDCTISNSCTCAENKLSCEQFCLCSSQCYIRFKGCDCHKLFKNCSSNCSCLSQNRDCDPELCRCNSNFNSRTCLLSRNSVPFCQNTMVLYNNKPRLLASHSLVCEGVGLFAGQEFIKGDYIGQYQGELLPLEISTARTQIYTSQLTSYLFDLDQWCNIDSYKYGNKIRFLNHSYSFLCNATVVMKFVNGLNQITMIAYQNIPIGDEIFFDYGKYFSLQWKEEFDQNTKAWIQRLPSKVKSCLIGQTLFQKGMADQQQNQKAFSDIQERFSSQDKSQNRQLEESQMEIEYLEVPPFEKTGTYTDPIFRDISTTTINIPRYSIPITNTYSKDKENTEIENIELQIRNLCTNFSKKK